ncbi:MAG: peptidoglycan DD-metalloendopeptidase family protein [Epsilonproteobacteria bacterium]|nr:peptidoglycan DD-metalloendopeptidase family protein [Campylobacterota bacterium]
MIKKIFILFALSTSFLSANIESKIEKTKKSLQQQKKQEKQLSRKLNQIAVEISREDQKLKKINKEILSTKQKIKAQNKKTKIKKGELKKIENLYNDLVKREKSVNKKITEIISKGITLEMIAQGANQNDQNTYYEKSTDNIIMQSLYNTYSDVLKSKFSKTKKRYIKLRNNINLVKTELDKIKYKLTDLKSQIKKYDQLKSLKTKTLKTLDHQKSAYLKKINRIQNERKSLDATLNKLKITKKEKNKTIIQSAPGSTTNVRQIGSSYQTSKLIKYRGPKTIAPLDNYTIAQNFGTYTDPIYKMKIFNESVILRTKTKNARVKNVLDGKVIYADKTSMLENVVIVKNRDNIHTIFAHLSQIAPTIKVGKKIPKGYVLGRVSRELTFEVTQNEKHINPMRLIK